MDFAPVRGDDPLRDAQAQTAALGGTGMAGVAAKKPFKNPGLQFRRQPCAGVFDLQAGKFSGALQGKRHRAAGPVIFYGVVRQVQE